MSGPLQDQVAVVTGAARGIGRATALRLARDGADVVIADLNLAGGEAVAAQVRALGRQALALQVDVSGAADRERIVNTTVERFGRLDILVNNAGIIGACRLLDASDADWDRIMDVNAKAVFFLSQLAARQMVKQQRGRIVNVASMAAKVSSSPYLVSYSCSKAVVVALTRSFGLNLARYGIRVNAVCPGMVDTDMWAFLDDLFAREQGLAPGEPTRQRLASIPVGRIETPEDVAGLIAFLAGPDSDYMTGQAINVTGGLVTW